MLKTRKRWVALLVAVAMVAVLVVPFAGTASASTTYSVTNVATVTSPSIANPATNPAGWANIGDLVVTMDPATAQSLNGTNSSFLYVQMPTTPTGYKISVQTLQTEAGVATSVYASVGLIGASASSYSAYLTFTTNPDYFQVTFPTPVTAGAGSSSVYLCPERCYRKRPSDCIRSWQLPACFGSSGNSKRGLCGPDPR